MQGLRVGSKGTNQGKRSQAFRGLLYQVIAGDASFGNRCSLNGLPVMRMPLVDPTILPNGPTLAAEKIQKIRDWILQGAPNN